MENYGENLSGTWKQNSNEESYTEMPTNNLNQNFYSVDNKLGVKCPFYFSTG